jgi:hypothetical protein
MASGGRHSWRSGSRKMTIIGDSGICQRIEAKKKEGLVSSQRRPWLVKDRVEVGKQVSLQPR